MNWSNDFNLPVRSSPKLFQIEVSFLCFKKVKLKWLLLVLAFKLVGGHVQEEMGIPAQGLDGQKNRDDIEVMGKLLHLKTREGKCRNKQVWHLWECSSLTSLLVFQNGRTRGKLNGLWLIFGFIFCLFWFFIVIFCFKSGGEVCEDQTVWPELCLSKLISNGLMSRLHASNQRQFWINYLW